MGSGALSMALLRAGAEVVGYELREDFAERARANVEAMLGPGARYRVELRDVYEGIEEVGLDRILLDLPEPWRVLPHATEALRPGGILCAYLPSINQTAQLRTAMDQQRVRDGLHPRGTPPDLAHRGPLGPARPPHGRPHRLPHHRPAAAALRGGAPPPMSTP